MARHHASTRNGTRAASAAGAVTETLRDGILTLRERAGEGAEQVTRLLKHQGQRYVNDRKAKAADRIASLSEVVRVAADRLHARDVETLARYVDAAADRVKRLARYIDANDLPEMAKELEQFARRRPAPVMGALFLAGLAAGRFINAGRSPPANSTAPTRSTSRTAPRTHRRRRG